MKKFRFYKQILSLTFAIILFFSCGSQIAYAYESYTELYKSKISTTLLATSQYAENKIAVSIEISSGEMKQNQKSNLFMSNSERTSINDMQSIIAKNREEVRAYFLNLNTEYAKSISSYADIIYICKYAPIVVASVTPEKLMTLAKSEKVLTICENNITGIEELDLSRSIIRANTIQSNSMFGYTGEGVKIGILESSGYPDLNAPELTDADITLISNLENEISSHATNVTSVIASQGNDGSPIGIAPNATIYCSYWETKTENNEVSNDFYERFEDLIDAGVNIINMSFRILYENDVAINDAQILSTNTYHNYDAFVDYVSYNSHVICIKSAGNNGASGVTTPGMAYNCITVGNLNDKNTRAVADDSIRSTSSYINSANLSNTASKPDLVAPGTDISGNNGTSFAAPHVAGAIALMLEQEPLLMYFPAGVKAILSAGVYKSIHHYTPNQRTIGTETNISASYTQYGAGLINCVENAIIINDENYSMGIINQSSSYATQTITCNANESIRVALAFLHSPSTDNDTTSTIANLDLKIYDPSGNLVGASTTTNNNIEIVDFTPTVSGTYTAKIILTQSNGKTPSIGIAWA